MAGPWGVLPVGSAASTTEVEEDVDGGTLGVLPMGLTASTIEVDEDIDDGPPCGGLDPILCPNTHRFLQSKA
jgi:hypothetical protein